MQNTRLPSRRKRAMLSARIQKLNSIRDGRSPPLDELDLLRNTSPPSTGPHRHELNPIFRPTPVERLDSLLVAISEKLILAQRGSAEGFEEPEAQAIESFHPFLRLSLELRLKIYCLSLPAPTTITSTATLSRDPSYIEGKCFTQRQKFEKRVPAILQVCKESRAEFLAEDGTASSHSVYKLCQGVDTRDIRRSLYVCLENDTWVVGESNMRMYGLISQIWGILK